MSATVVHTSINLYLNIFISSDVVKSRIFWQRYVDRTEGVRYQLTTLRQTPSLLKVLTNFTFEEFEELCCKDCHTIVTNARSTELQKQVSGRPPKLNPEQHLLHFILY